jgi:predicted GIY-YIG superfamily endonuclease
MIYLIKNGGSLKIGFTNNMETRFKQYKSHAIESELLEVKEGSRKDEGNVQKLCEEFKLQGEWFTYNTEVIRLFSEYNPETFKPIITVEELQKIENRKKKADLRMQEYEANVAMLQKYFKERYVIQNKSAEGFPQLHNHQLKIINLIENADDDSTDNLVENYLERLIVENKHLEEVKIIMGDKILYHRIGSILQ